MPPMRLPCMVELPQEQAAPLAIFGMLLELRPHRELSRPDDAFPFSPICEEVAFLLAGQLMSPRHASLPSPPLQKTSSRLALARFGFFKTAVALP